MTDVGSIAHTKLIMLIVLVLTLIPAFAQVVAPVPTTRIIGEIDVVALVTAVFAGVSTIAALIFLPLLAARTKRTEAATAATALEVIKAQAALAETNLKIVNAQLEIAKVKDTVDLVERNTDSMTTTIEKLSKAAGIVQGKAEEKLAGVEMAATLAEGERRGMEKERSAVAAAGVAAASTGSLVQGEKPVDVVDEQAAKIGERSATALEKTADAAVEATRK